MGSDLDGAGIGGFKCYHCYSARADTQQSYIDEFLPDWTWQVADERGWFIMLHIVRDPALDDPENQRQIREKCERFPNAQLILAHAARGFHGPNTTRSIASLRGLSNVWFDTSAICEAEPMVAILDEFGPRRLLYGSDFPVSPQRRGGRSRSEAASPGSPPTRSSGTTAPSSGSRSRSAWRRCAPSCTRPTDSA